MWLLLLMMMTTMTNDDDDGGNNDDICWNACDGGAWLVCGIFKNGDT